jgi:hypothetical protein
MADSDNFPSDQLLVERCQLCDQVAWGQLQTRLQERARHVLYRALGRDASDRALKEQLTVDLLSELFLNDKLLEACRVFGRSLDPILDYLLHREVVHYYRERARHRRHELPLDQVKLPELKMLNLPPGIQDELVKKLTPTEREYFDWRQSPLAEGAPPCPYSDAYARQLEHRIMNKAVDLLFGE